MPSHGLTQSSVRASSTGYGVLRRLWVFGHEPTPGLQAMSSFFLCFAVFPPGPLVGRLSLQRRL